MKTTSRKPRRRYRVSIASIGRNFLKITDYIRSERLSDSQIRATLMALRCYIEDENTSLPPDSKANLEVYDELRNDVDKSARLSRMAKERAKRRRQAREETRKEAMVDIPQPSPSIPKPPRYDITNPPPQLAHLKGRTDIAAKNEFARYIHLYQPPDPDDPYGIREGIARLLGR